MLHKVSELEGALLDAAVAKVCAEHFGEEELMLCAKHGFHPSADWGDGGPIIERERIAAVPSGEGWMAWHGAFLEVGGSVESVENVCERGPTPLVAAMRCFVASKFGESIDLP